MYLSLDVEECSFNSDRMDLVFYRHTFRGSQEYITGLSKISNVPKYQALALQRALKEFDPKFPSCTLTVLSGGRTNEPTRTTPN